VRALELEKEDILKQYRQLAQENQRLLQNMETVGSENKFNYEQMQRFEREAAGMNVNLIEMQNREQGYIHEIKTLEKHIDHLTHQLEVTLRDQKEVQRTADTLT